VAAALLYLPLYLLRTNCFTYCVTEYEKARDVSRRLPRPPLALQSKWPLAAASRRRSGRRRERGARTLTRRGTDLQLRGMQFTSFIGTKVRILTPHLQHRPATHLQHTTGEDADAMMHQHSKATYLHYTAWLRAREAEAARVKSAGTTQFTCFTGTKALRLLALLVQTRARRRWRG
jgi:hypothetical protein